MKITIITLFPQMINGFINESILKRAAEKKLVEYQIINLRDFAVDRYGSVDDKPYGGGVGMVLRVDVIYKALQKIKDTKARVILTSAKGKTYRQSMARSYATLDHLILIAGHYEGVDERIADYVDEEVSVGDYVLTGGELASCIIADSVTRLIPGVLKHEEATEIESFSEVDGKQMLEYPQYTRPEEFMGKKVPEILLSGNHKNIMEWRKEQAGKITKKRRPDLLCD